jgi:TonB family protein
MVARTPRIYSPSDTDVVPPVHRPAGRAAIPRPRADGGSLMMDVIIGTDGSVESATMGSQPNPAYDRLVLQAAKTWQYQPATLNGTPVKYRKRIQLTLVPAAK